MKNNPAAARYINNAKSGLINLLNRHSLNQYELAELLQISPASVSRYLNPARHDFFSLAELATLCAHLQIPLAAALPAPDWIDTAQDYNQLFAELSAQQQGWLLAIHQAATELYGK